MADIDLTIPMTPRPEDTTEIANGYIVPNADSHISRWCIETQRLNHDSFLPEECAKYIPVGGVAIDAGAFIGDHSIRMSQALGNDGLLIAIEPNPYIFSILTYNCALFPQHNTFCLDVALGAEKSWGKMVTDSANLGMTQLRQHDEGSVQITTLDDIASYITNRPISFIKMDLEGCEYNALLGAKKLLTVDRSVIVIEMNTTALAQHSASYISIWDILTLHKYTWSILQPEITDPHAPQYDLLCLPT